jgi:hypothetical protein
MDENRKGRVHEKYVDELDKYNQSSEIDIGRRREIDVEPTAYYTNKYVFSTMMSTRR